LVHLSFLKICSTISKIGSTGIKTGSTGFSTVPLCHFLTCQSILSEKSHVQIFGKPVQPDFGPAQPDLGPVESPAESPSEPKTPWWKPVQPV
jgi:hypothetical protein